MKGGDFVSSADWGVKREGMVRRRFPLAMTACLVLAGCATSDFGGRSDVGDSALIGGKPSEPQAVLAARAAMKDVSSLNSFQWAIWNNGGVFFLPLDGYLMAAMSEKDDVIETRAPKLTATLMTTRERRVVSIHSFVAPQEISAGDWVLQHRLGERWVKAPDFEFDGEAFTYDGGAQRISIDQFGEIRFLKR